MNMRQLTRRMVLGVAVVMVAASTALGTGQDASAEGKWRDSGSKAGFKADCEANVIGGVQGTIVDDAKSNTVTCVYGDGARSYCDQAGNNCGWSPPPKREEPSGGQDSHIGTGGEATTEVGDMAPLTPVVDRRPVQEAQPVLELVQQPVQEPALEFVAAEPVAAEVVAEPVAAEPAAPVEDQP